MLITENSLMFEQYISSRLIGEQVFDRNMALDILDSNVDNMEENDPHIGSIIRQIMQKLEQNIELGDDELQILLNVVQDNRDNMIENVPDNESIINQLVQDISSQLTSPGA